jgi:hypothetical protein
MVRNRSTCSRLDTTEDSDHDHVAPPSLARILDLGMIGEHP